MPKFGTEIDIVLKGIAKILMIMGIKYEDEHYSWFLILLQQLWEGL